MRLLFPKTLLSALLRSCLLPLHLSSQGPQTIFAPGLGDDPLHLPLSFPRSGPLVTHIHLCWMLDLLLQATWVLQELQISKRGPRRHWASPGVLCIAEAV